MQNNLDIRAVVNGYVVTEITPGTPYDFSRNRCWVAVDPIALGHLIRSLTIMLKKERKK